MSLRMRVSSLVLFFLINFAAFSIAFSLLRVAVGGAVKSGVKPFKIGFARLVCRAMTRSGAFSTTRSASF